MNVNMISETSWILGRCAQELRDRLGWTINSNKPAEVDYHLPYWRGLPEPGSKTQRRPKVRVGFFTHGFDRARAFAGRHFDAAICMNRQMLHHVRDQAISTVIRPGVEMGGRMPVFGVMGRVYRDDRKGQDLVRKAVAAGHDFLALGPGPWPCETLGRRVTDRELVRQFWRRIDYFVVTSRDEGGPVPALEAIANRVPVIAPDVGWCWELPVIKYERGLWESLSAVLTELTVTPTWEEWASAHRAFVDELWRGLEAA